MDYLMDTNVIIGYLHKNQKIQSNMGQAYYGGNKLLLSDIIAYEMSRGFIISPNSQKEAVYSFFLKNCQMVLTNPTILKRAAEIYADLHKKRLLIGELDIIIAAQCLEHGCTLVTNNIKHFSRVDGLPLADWTK